MHHGVPLVFGCLHFFGLYFEMIGLLLQLVMLLPWTWMQIGIPCEVGC